MKKYPHLLCGFIALLLFGFPLFWGLRYSGLDASIYDVPFLCDLKSILREGRSWLISETINNGEPLLANLQSEFLYPPRWAVFFFSPTLQKSLEVVFHLTLAAASSSLLLSTFGLRKYLCVAGGLAFVFSGTVIDLILHATYMVSACWFPLSWALGRIIFASRSPRVIHVFLLALALLAFIVGGDPQGFSMAFFVLLIEWICNSRKLSNAFLISAIFLLVVGIASPVLIAMEREFQLTARSMHGLGVDAFRGWSFDFPSALASVLPSILSQRSAQGVMFWAGWVTGEPNSIPWNRNPYLGYSLLPFAFLALREKRARTVSLVFGITLLLAIGDNIPGLATLLSHVPLLNGFRFPMKYFLFVSLSVVVLAFIGLDSTLHLARKQIRRPFSIVLVFLFLQFLVLIYLQLYSAQIDGWVSRVHGMPVEGESLLLSQIFKNASIHSLSFTLLASLFLFADFLPMRRLVLFLPFVLLMDLGIVAINNISIDFDWLNAPSPLIAIAQKNRPILCHKLSLITKTEGFNTKRGRISRDYGNATDIVLKHFDSPNLTACDGIANGPKYSPFETPANAQLREAIGKDNLAASIAFGCNYLLTDNESNQLPEITASPLSVQGLTDMPRSLARLYSISPSIAEAFVIPHPIRLSDTESVVQAVLRSKSINEITSIVDFPKREASFTLADNTTTRIQKVDWNNRSLVKLDLTGSGPVAIGINTTYAQGWTAEQNNHPLPTFRVAGNLLGAMVPDASLGTITLRYQLPLIWLSQWIASFSIIALFILLAYLRHKLNSVESEKTHS